MEKIQFHLKDEYITLQSLLKAENLVASGGEAKYLIIDGLVKVNGECETRRGKKLRDGDVVEFDGYEITVCQPKA